MSNLIPSTPFINVLIKVRPGDTAGTYNVETAPTIPWVTQSDTVINYQIFDSGKYDIGFNRSNPMTILTADTNEFSPPSVSVSGKQLTFSDANTSPLTLKFNLNFVDGDGVEFSHDPEVRNEPEA